jgi:hypothetical protein
MSKDLITQPKKDGFLKAAIRSLSPNAMWDAIKNARAVFGWIVGGGAVIGTAVTSIIQRLRGVPQDVIGILLVAFLWLIALTVVYSVSWYKRKRAQPVSGTGENELPVIEDAEHAKEIEILNRRITVLEQEKAQLEKGRKEDALAIRQCENKAENLSRDWKALRDELKTFKWLKEIADKQSVDVGSFVSIHAREMCNSNFERAVPFAQFSFVVVNNSVYDISLEDTITGYIVFGEMEQRLAQPPFMFQNEVKDCPYGEGKRFIVEQRLTPEEAALISNQKNLRQPNFEFDELQVTIKGGKGDKQIQPKQIKLSGRVINAEYGSPVRILRS